MLQDGDGHLLGTIILHNTDYHQGNINRPEIVDGQQRITTLVLLLKAIQQQFVKYDKLEKADEVKALLMCKGYDDIEQNKVLLGDLDNPDFEKIMNLKYDDLKNPNLINAYNDFSSWLEEGFDFGKLNKFYYKLTNVAVILRLDVGLAKDAYKLFETINNRGLRLSATDIIKNFLLGHAAKINDNVTLKNVKELWSSIISNLDGIDTDDFFRQYMCSILKRKVSKTNLVSEFKSYYLNHVENADLLGEFAYYVEEETFDLIDR